VVVRSRLRVAHANFTVSYQQLNPVALRAELEAALERLWGLAERGPAARSAAAVAG
jgi:hypothetical protein